MCKVSLILPSLNVAQYMDECLQSVMAQTLKEIEIICVDAGSTDGTVQIIEKYALQDSRIRLIHSDKKSYGYQMNLGISQASGHYVGIVETDDYVPPVMYEELYDTAVAHQAQIVKADFYRFRTEGDRIQRTYNRLDPSCTYYDRVIEPRTTPRVFRLIMNTWSGIYLRSFLEENQIRHNESEGASFQDNGFWFQTFCCAKRAYFVGKPYYMNRRDNEASSVANPGKVYCMTQEWEFIYQWLKQDPQRFAAFIGPYALRKYHSLLFTAQRIAPEYKAEFLTHMSQEMGKLLRDGEYDRQAFTNYEWRRLQLVVRHPDHYYNMYVSKCWHPFAAVMLQRLKKHKKFSSLVRRADHTINRIQIVWSWIQYEGTARTLRRIKWKNTKDWIARK